jgi:hypothetical protein
MPRSTLRRSVSERVRAMQAVSSVGHRGSLMPAAARSALVELLLSEFADTLPGPLAVKVRTADLPGTMTDWFFAASVYGAVAHDPVLAARFLEMVDSDPREAGLALATVLASKQDPPPRNAAEHLCDILGLTLQLGAAGCVLCSRLVLFFALASLIRSPAATLAPISVFPTLYGLGLVALAQQGGIPAARWLTLAAAWVGLEALQGPRLLEALRRLPARLTGVTVLLPRRAEAFDVVWRLQSLLALLGVLWALCCALAHSGAVH